MSSETKVTLSALNIGMIRYIVGAGQPVGFTLIEHSFRDSGVSAGSSYTFHGLDRDGDLQFKNDKGDNSFINNKNVAYATIQLNATEEDLQRAMAEVSSKKLAALRAASETLLSGNYGFQVGDAIQWKEGMKHSKLPQYGEPVIVLQVLDEPLPYPSNDRSHQYVADRNDIVIGYHDADGDFISFAMDSRRFKKFN